MRKEYHMTAKEYGLIVRASQPVPLIYTSGGEMIGSQQENANAAWRVLAAKRGFEWDTVEKVPGKDNHWFSAEELEKSSANS